MSFEPEPRVNLGKLVLVRHNVIQLQHLHFHNGTLVDEEHADLGADGKKRVLIAQHVEDALFLPDEDDPKYGFVLEQRNAKDMGRQTYRFFEPIMNARAVERQSVEADLRHALQQHEMVLHYQPKIDLVTGAISGAEALIRWQHPNRGLLSPAQFIPIAEDCRLIVPIGEWVLGEACRQAQRWAVAGLTFGTMAVNVSAMQFREGDFAQRVFEILSETGMDPKLLELELTESVLMMDAESTASTLQSLRRKGVRVALDDFGTGFSSLSYLQKFPVDCLKIDQSFVRQISAEEGAGALVTAIIQMAHALKLRVVAEGVETKDELQFIRERGCDEGQGYYFSRPVASDSFKSLLKRKIDVIPVVASEKARLRA